MNRLRTSPVALGRWLPPLIALVVGLSVWQAVVVLLKIPRILLPPPTAVATAAWQNAQSLVTATGVTAAAALTGFALSLVMGTIVAMLFSQSRWIRNSLFPYAIFLQTVPIVAIAPLVVIWLGEGFAAVVVIAWIVSLFPIITNGTAGMLRVPTTQRELFQLCKATRWQTLRQLQLPAALPNLVTGARIASGLSVLGAIVGEYFAGAGADRAGLGYLIFAAKDQFALDTLFAAVLLCTLLGVAMFTLVGWIGQRGLLGWMDSVA